MMLFILIFVQNEYSIMQHYMKKLFFIVLSILLFLSSCGTNQQSKLLSSTPKSSSNNSKISVKKEFTMLSTDRGYASKNGYYMIASSGDKVDSSGSSFKIIRYFDYASLQDIVLCNKPNCSHSDNTCNAYLSPTFHMAQLFETNGKVYVVNGQAMMMGHSKDPDTAPAIYQMNPDGTNRTRLLNFSSGMRVSGPFLQRDNMLYAQASTLKQTPVSGSGNGTIQSFTTSEENPVLVAIDLDKKTTETVCSMKDRQVIGAYKNSVVIMETKSDVDFSKLENNDSAINKAWENMHVKIITLDIDTKTEKVHFSALRNEFDFTKTYGSSVYFNDTKDKKIKGLNLDNDKITDIITDLPKTGYIDSIVDGRLIYTVSEDKYLNPEIDTYYGVDLATGEKKQLMQFLQKPRDIIRILGETDKQFLVISGQDSKQNTYRDPTTGKSVQQYDITKTYYALINKDDYWNSKANYNILKEVN
jgi:hypothetical protein